MKLISMLSDEVLSTIHAWLEQHGIGASLRARVEAEVVARHERRKPRLIYIVPPMALAKAYHPWPSRGGVA